MTAKELIEKLKEQPLDAIILMPRDAEGNGVRPIDDCEMAFYDEEDSEVCGGGRAYFIDDPAVVRACPGCPDCQTQERGEEG